MKISHVLVTRPEPQASELAAMLRECGVTPIVAPAFTFEGTGRRFRPDPAWRAAPERLAVFTSPRAVAFGLAEGVADSLRDARVAAIGPATAKALGERGLAALEPADGYTSEALLAHPELSRRPGRAIVFAAPGGRQALKRGLEALGWAVRVLEVYRRVPLAPGPEVARRVLDAARLASVWTSGNAFDGLLGALGGPARDRVLGGLVVVVSERLGAIARDRGAGRVAVAAGPDNASLLACVVEHAE